MTAERRTIVVPLDGSAHALVALPVARHLAQVEGAILHIVHVGGRVIPPHDLLVRLGLSRDDMAGTVVSQLAGDPAAEILRVAKQQGGLLIVLCAVTGLPAPLGIMGPIAEAILREATCPLVLVRPERGLATYKLGRIVLPHDGTPTSAAAIGPGVELARRAGAELLVLHVAGARAPQPVEPGTLTVPRYVDQPQHEWAEWKTEFLSRLICEGCLPEGLKLRLELGKGDPGAAILERAGGGGADLVLLAWRGKLDQERAPIVRAVIRDSQCPVMVMRTV